MNIDWDSLKYFLAIARNGSLAGAAQTLGVNHSTAFRRLNTFEKELGGRLFERLSSGYALTSLGKELFAHAQEIDKSFDDLERKIVGKDIRPQGTVKITVPSSFAYHYLPRYLADFNDLYPDIQVELLVSNLEFNMTNRQADICVRVTSSPPEHLVGRQVCSIRWGVYGSKAYADKFDGPLDLEDLKYHRLIGAAGNMRSHSGFSWLDKKFPEQIYTRCDDLVGMACLAEAGRGLAFLPNDLHHTGIEKLLTFDPAGINQLWVLTHPDLRNVERIKMVMKYLQTVFSAEKSLQ